MGTPASSALRADNATSNPALNGAGDAFGSLTGLGGPKKFKKKPVLVLDPEELERAHMMFQEASAEMLGEQVEPAPRPAPVSLGLAPMDDAEATPEDMGQTDDDQDGGDDEAIPTGEDLLHMTSSRHEESEEEQEFAMRALEEGFDEDHRIFPTLPVQPEEDIAAQEAAEQLPAEPEEFAAEPAAELPVEEPQPAPRSSKIDDLRFRLSAMTAGSGDYDDEEDEESGVSDHFAALMPQIRRETPVRPQEPVEQAPVEPEVAAAPEPAPAPEPEAPAEPVDEMPPVETELWDDEPAPLPEEAAPLPGQEEPVAAEPEAPAAFEPTPRFEDAPEALPATPHIAPFEQQRAEKLPETEAQAPEAPEPEAPAHDFADDHFDDVPPAEEAPLADLPPEEPEYVEPPRRVVADDGPRWQPESYEAPDMHSYDDEPQPEVAAEEPFDELEEPAGNYTEIDDEPVDGYAFMYGESQRGRALRGAAPGEANSLRARLIRERQQETEAAAEAASGSVIARFMAWLRGLFG